MRDFLFALQGFAWIYNLVLACQWAFGDILDAIKAEAILARTIPLALALSVMVWLYGRGRKDVLAEQEAERVNKLLRQFEQ